jgi:hypothetical protein
MSQITDVFLREWLVEVIKQGRTSNQAFRKIVKLLGGTLASDEFIHGIEDDLKFARLEAITSVMDTIEAIYKAYKMSEEELNKTGSSKLGAMIGELDMLQELHRLLYEQKNY